MPPPARPAWAASHATAALNLGAVCGPALAALSPDLRHARAGLGGGVRCPASPY